MTKPPTCGRPRAPASAGTRPIPALPASVLISNRRRTILRELMARHGLRPSDLARQAGLSGPNLIYNFLNGISHSLSQDTLEHIDAAFPDAGFPSLAAPAATPAPIPAACRVAAEARAGMGQDHLALLPAQRTPLLPAPGAWDGQPRLFRVLVGPKRAAMPYPAGSLLVCRPFGGPGEVLPEGCRVVVQQRLGRRTEVTVRELVVDQAGARSAPPSPQQLLWPLREPGQAADGLAILGVVVASWQPEPMLMPS